METQVEYKRSKPRSLAEGAARFYAERASNYLAWETAAQSCFGMYREILWLLANGGDMNLLPDANGSVGYSITGHGIEPPGITFSAADMIMMDEGIWELVSAADPIATAKRLLDEAPGGVDSRVTVAIESLPDHAGGA